MSWYPVSSDKESCVLYNNAEGPYEEFSCLYPKTFGKTYLQFEKDFDPVPTRDWMREHPMVPVMACLSYGILIYWGSKTFASTKPWDWRQRMACWNLCLSVFSAIGFWRTAPQLFHNLFHYGLYNNFCFDPESNFGSGSTGLWVQLFCLSKFPELFDTFFIVIHKKPLIFLHWYHHISVLLYCWHSYVTSSPTGLFFVTMNYMVHAIMYFYYFLMAVKCKPKSFKAVYITMLQISQMVVGVAVTIYGCYILGWKLPHQDGDTAGPCWLTPDNNYAALVMYGSYLALFLQFFLQRYAFGGKRTSTKKANKKVD